jgi:hypothetical protein
MVQNFETQTNEIMVHVLKTGLRSHWLHYFLESGDKGQADDGRFGEIFRLWIPRRRVGKKSRAGLGHAQLWTNEKRVQSNLIS